jgi:hypothetical protein
MTKIKCMLVLFIIFTGSLFSQDERNEILEEGAITLINTAVVIEVDTVVIEESVSEPGEKVDLSNYDFYNDYLDYIKKTNSMDDIGDTNVFIPKREKLGMLVLETGGTFSTIPDRPIVSFTIRAPVSNYFHILLKHGRAFDTYRYYSIMVGYSFFIKRSIIDISVGPSLPIAGGAIAFDFEEAMYSVMDITYYYRLSNSVVFSATVGGGYRLISSLSLGLGYTL